MTLVLGYLNTVGIRKFLQIKSANTLKNPQNPKFGVEKAF
jgi:hypothetical protein